MFMINGQLLLILSVYFIVIKQLKKIMQIKIVLWSLYKINVIYMIVIFKRSYQSVVNLIIQI
jgi:hypothetical protein